MEILRAEEIMMNFGGLRAVDSFNLLIEDNELVGLIGPNGAGKTTIFNIITGVYKPTKGSISLCGKNIKGKKPSEISKFGISRTFQNIRLFSDLTVLDNVKIGMGNRFNYNLLTGIFKLPEYFKQEKEMDRQAMELLKIFDLDQFSDYAACNLPYGKQRELEIARALASKPKLLLLDEPAAGMNPQETDNLMNTISKVRDEFNVAILLIEHDMQLVMGICERIMVLNYGRILAEGTSEEIQNNPEVVKAYLGA